MSLTGLPAVTETEAYELGWQMAHGGFQRETTFLNETLIAAFLRGWDDCRAGVPLEKEVA